MTTRIAHLMNQPLLMLRRTPLLALSLLFSLLVPLAAGSARAELVVHVSPAGDDAWSGGLTSPSADRTDGPVVSLRRARDRVRELRAAEGGRRDEPVRVVVADGTYLVDEPLILGPEDGGTAAAPVSYEAAAGARPVISGGRRITGFRPGTGADAGLWVVDLPQQTPWRFEQLFVNGRRVIRAREPDVGTFAVAAAEEIPLDASGQPLSAEARAKLGPKDRPPRARQTVRLSAADFAAVAGLPPEAIGDVLLNVYHKWDITKRFLEAVDPAAERLFTSGGGMKPWNRWDEKSTVTLENARAFLDEPGEWFLDRQQRLFYKPRPGESLESAELIAPVCDERLTIRGEPAAGRFCDHVSFSGLAFRHARLLTPAGGVEPAQAAAPLGAVVTVTGGREILFRDCEISRVGRYGLWLRAGCRGCRVERCLVEDLGAGGIRIGEMGPARDAAHETAGNTVDNCIIRHGGRLFPCAVGVWIGFSPDNVVSHNEIFDFFYTGISVGWRWGYAESSCKRNQILDNHVHRIGQGLLSDMGGIYTLGPSEGTVVRGNVFHDIESHSYGGWGLYTDEGSTGITFEHNLVFNTKSGGFHQHYGKDNVIRHNVLLDATDQQIQATRVEDHRSFTFEHNIIAWRTGKAITGPWDRMQTITGTNCWWNTAGEPVRFLDKPLADWQAAGHELGSIVADPLFVDPATRDYRLRPESPAIALGFKPYDWSQAGVFGDAAWVARAREGWEAPPSRP